jgi:ATP-dependent DNA ligase
LRLTKLRQLRVEKSPFPAKVKDEAVATWIKPSLVAEVKFAEWTNKGELRQPVYLGLRSEAGEGRHARAGTTAKVAKRVEPTPRTRNELVHDRIAKATAKSKQGLPWLKLMMFGDRRNDCRRQRVTGLPCSFVCQML